MGEARAVKHAQIHKEALVIVWKETASFTRIDAVHTLLCRGGTIQGVFTLIWARSRTLLAADGAQLAVKQFVKRQQPMTFTRVEADLHILTRVRDSHNEILFYIYLL